MDGRKGKQRGLKFLFCFRYVISCSSQCGWHHSHSVLMGWGKEALETTKALVHSCSKVGQCHGLRQLSLPGMVRCCMARISPDTVRSHVAWGSRDWRACGQVWAPGSKSCYPMWPTYEIRHVSGVYIYISKSSLLEVSSHAGDTWDVCHPSMHTVPFTTSSEWSNSEAAAVLQVLN